MALHGHTTIELTNIETGEVEKFEDDNIVTNALSYFFRDIGWSSGIRSRMLSNATDSIDATTKGIQRVMRVLTGGLLLLDTPLDEDVDNIFLPAGVETIGCGASIAYSGLNANAGSYNQAESGPIEGGYKHVWDFNSAQGNGNIACACLTTREGGFTAGGTFPYDPTYTPHSTTGTKNVLNPNDIISSVSSFDGDKYDDAGNQVQNQSCSYPLTFLYADFEKNFIVMPCDYRDMYNTVSYTGYGFLPKKSLTVNIKRYPFTTMSLFDEHWEAEKDSTLKTIEQVTIEMPDTLKTVIDSYKSGSTSWVANVNFYSSEGYIIIVIARKMSGGNNLDANDNIHIWKIKVEDWSSEHIIVPNTTGKSIIMYCDSSGYTYLKTHNLVASDNYLLVISTDYYVYRININEPTDVIPVTLPDGTHVKVTVTSASNNAISQRLGFHGAYVLNEKVHAILDNIPVIIDLTTGVMKYEHSLLETEFCSTYQKNQYDRFLHRVLVQKSPGFLLINNLHYNNSYQWQGSYYRRLAELLVTINNLASHVTKTSAQTMKVTYTLMQTDEGGES